LPGIDISNVKLMENGLCLLTESSATKRDSTGEPLVKRIALAEPMVVEAVVMRKAWSELTVNTMTSAQNATNASGEGIAFESCSLPIVDAVFQQGVIEQQPFPCIVANEFYGKWARGRSACGVVVRACANADELRAWAAQLLSARFDGQVAPMCAPWARVGPDLLMMLTRWVPADGHSQRVWAALQLKLAKDVDIAKAMLTINPELLLHDNRAKEPKAISTYECVYKSIFQSSKRNEPVFRALIHCFDPASEDDTKRNNNRATFYAEAKKQRTHEDAMLYLGPRDVEVALKASLGEQQASKYLEVVLQRK